MSAGSNTQFDSVSVVGLGYIGLPTAAVIAGRQTAVIGIDVNDHVVSTINRGDIHIVEPNLGGLVKTGVSTGYLKAVSKPEPSDAFLIAVPTPVTQQKKADLSYVLSAGKNIAPVLKAGDLVVLESTSPVGATEQLVSVLAQARPDLKFPKYGQDNNDIDVHIAYCPERVLPGKVIEELVSNDRAIGGMTDTCTQRAIALYKIFVEGDLVPTDTRSAEFCKLAENAFRDVNIAYANELANVCDALDMNVWEVIRLANRHPRVNILNPGPGVGGHCIAVDPWFIAEKAPDHTPVIQAARRVNDGRPQRVFDQVSAAAKAFEAKENRLAKIACLGVAFKANIDDIRESPALEIASHITKSGIGKTSVIDPYADPKAVLKKHPEIDLKDYDWALNTADIVVVLVDHVDFTAESLMSAQARHVLDFRGILARAKQKSK